MSKEETMVERQAGADGARVVVADLCRAVDGVEWIGHDGSGDPPMDFPDFVQVKFHDGDTAFGIRWDWDQNWCWSSEDLADGCIVAYRHLGTPHTHRAMLSKAKEGTGE